MLDSIFDETFCQLNEFRFDHVHVQYTHKTNVDKGYCKQWNLHPGLPLINSELSDMVQWQSPDAQDLQSSWASGGQAWVRYRGQINDDIVQNK